MIGLWYAAYGLGELFTKNLVWPFKTIHVAICNCLCLYFLLCACLAVVVLLVFVCFAKHYKLRVRNYTVPVYQMAEEHAEKYL